MAPRPHLPILVYAMLSLLWGSTWIAIKLGLTDMPPFTSSGIRLLVAAGILAAYMRVLRVPHPRGIRPHLMLLGVGLTMFGLPYGLIYWGQQHIPSGLASVLFASLPFFVAIEAHFLVPGESLTPPKIIGTLVGFSGILVVFSDRLSHEAPHGEVGGEAMLPGARELVAGPEGTLVSSAPNLIILGMGALVLSALVSGFGNVIARRVSRRYHPVVLNALPQFYGGLLLSTLAVLGERDQEIRWTAASVGALVYLTIIGSCMAFVLYFWLLRHMETTTVSLIALITPVTALFLGWLILDESVTARLVIGAGLVAAGIAMATAWPSRRDERAGVELLPGHASGPGNLDSEDAV